MTTSVDSDLDREASRFSGWVGWVIFGAVIMIVSGSFSIIWGIVGIVRDQVFVAGPKGNVINLDYTTWGWIHLFLGIVVVLTGLALFTGSLWARILAVVFAVLSAIGNLLVLTAYPVWSTIVITLDVLVIYAITVHGNELAN